MTPPLVWLDLEMTGLDPERHVILEIASVVTDGHLRTLEAGPHRVIHQTEDVLSRIDIWSAEQHGVSGLLEKVRRSEWTCEAAEAETLAFLTGHCAAGVAPLCGNSVWQDRRFLIRHMPRLAEFFHYRNIDVSSIKELVRRWYPELPPFRKEKRHLALSDIEESIRELAYYRRSVFKPPEDLQAPADRCAGLPGSSAEGVS